jgi:antitoxin (DNA-binding transcriptional repressor) of toxin-antitoxin stability system
MTRNARPSELRIPVSEFKAKCLSVLDQIEQRKIRRVVLTRRGKPLAEIGPVKGKRAPLWGAHRGQIEFVEGVDLTEPATDEPWDAELGILHR